MNEYISVRDRYVFDKESQKENDSRDQLFTFMGIDGSGKSTQTERLFKKLSRINKTYIYHHKIEDNKQFHNAMKYLYRNTENNDQEYISYLVAFEFLQFFVNDVLEKLEKGYFVILDRSVFDLYVVQKNLFKCDFSRGWEIIEFISKLGTNIYLSIDYEEAYKRVVSRGKSIKLHEKKENLQRQKKGYDSLKSENIYIIDANRSENSISDEIEKLVDERLLLKTIRERGDEK